MAGILLSIVLEGVFTQPIERDAPEVAGRDDPIGVDVIKQEWDRGACDTDNMAIRHDQDLRTLKIVL
ncbi:hypothetical protein OAJ60_04840 [Planctomycetaceae bacterium]|nr:hypothetical protein [Planctomycetaceae bacterium]